MGAVIGAAAGGGKGAAIGAGIGAAAAVVGVLSTRGKATEIYPESTMTFRLDTPLVISTVKSRQAFLSVSPRDYERAPNTRVAARNMQPQPVIYPYPPYPPYPPVYGPYPRYPGSRVGVIPSIVLVTPVVIDRRHDRRRR